jgi:hypothetical protein
VIERIKMFIFAVPFPALKNNLKIFLKKVVG